MLFIFISGKSYADFVLWFLVPKNNDPRKYRSPKAAYSESNKGRYYRNFMV